MWREHTSDLLEALLLCDLWIVQMAVVLDNIHKYDAIKIIKASSSAAFHFSYYPK